MSKKLAEDTEKCIKEIRLHNPITSSIIQKVCAKYKLDEMRIRNIAQWYTNQNVIDYD